MSARALALFALLAAAGGCVRVTFTQTRSAYKPHPAATQPEVFVDRLPGQPYDSVGIIQVIGGQSLSHVLEAASSKGQEVGCDVVVDRTIYPVPVGMNAPRWTTILSVASSDEVEPARRRDVEYLAVGAPSVQSNTQQQQNVMNGSTHASQEPASEHEFICGIYRQVQAPAPPGPVQAPEAPAPASSP
jgi:hypothetical protein